MPAKNAIKTYVKDGYYHVYNRGVEKRTIFQNTQDYKVFLGYLKEHLSPPSIASNQKKFEVRGKVFKGLSRQPKNFYYEIDLLAYCLMPNHFHLLLKQTNTNSMEKFLRTLMTRYSMYFNKKYDRVGSLLQGPYKASIVSDDRYLLHISKYIHLNPAENTQNLTEAYSSYADYLKLRNTPWIKPNPVLNFFNKSLDKEFKKINSYKDFVEKLAIDKSTFSALGFSP